MKTMKLTPLGRIANQHSVLTPLKFWQDLLQEIRRIEDRDGRSWWTNELRG